jgi:hypothetical protein
MNDFTKDNFLAHHGVQGMHWGIRRYQPYGEGGYDPKHKGKYTGKEKKATYKYLKDRYATDSGHNSDIVKSFRDTDRYKQQAKAMRKAERALNRATGYEEAGRRELRKKINKSGFDKNKHKELLRKQTEAEQEYERLKKEGEDAMAADAKKYIKETLGRYKNKKVKHIVSDDLAKMAEIPKVTRKKMSDLLYEDLVRQYEYVDLSKL